MQSKQLENSENKIMANTQTTAKCTCNRLPLTDEEIADIVVEMNGNEPTALFWRDLARAIEAAHGIKGEA